MKKKKSIQEHSFLDKTNYKIIIKNYYNIYKKINKIELKLKSMDILLFDWINRSTKMITKTIDFYNLVHQNKIKYSIKKKNYYFTSSYEIFNSDMDLVHNYLFYRIIVNNNERYDATQYFKLTKKILFKDKIKIFFKSILKFFYQNKDINTLIYKPGIGKFCEIYLNIRINKAPFIYYIDPLEEKSKFNIILRNEFKKLIPKKLNKKQILILKILIDITPISYLEDLEINLNYINKKIPDSVKKVFCTDGLYTDDLFKIFLAFTKKKIKLYVAQHGMHNSLKKIHFEEKISDYFLSYFKRKKNKKVIPIGMVNKPQIKKIVYCKKNKDIINVFPPIHHGMFFDEKSIQQLKKFFYKIDNNSFRNSFRFHNLTKKDDFALFKNGFKNIDFMNNHHNYQKSLFKYRFSIFHYFSTGYLELMAADFPSILILNKKNLNTVCNNGRKLLYKMNKKKLIFFDYKEASDNINYLYNNIEKIWIRKDINNLKNEFRYIFGFYDKNYLNTLVKYLK
jgi:putative transferase (TIGR04331 family)